MAATHDHTLSPVHAHINLVGWVTMFLSGLFYATYPGSQGRLAGFHLVLSVLGLLIMAPGIAGVLLGYPWGEPLAGVGSLMTLIAIVIFALIVFSAPGRQRA
ncbi:hypothetical protein [Rhizobium setariae]|nr:hypothetical protein [Rhizobium setariae]